MKISLYGFRKIGAETSDVLATSLACVNVCQKCMKCEVALFQNSVVDSTSPETMLVVIYDACFEDYKMVVNAVSIYMRDLNYPQIAFARRASWKAH